MKLFTFVLSTLGFYLIIHYASIWVGLGVALVLISLKLSEE